MLTQNPFAESPRSSSRASYSNCKQRTTWSSSLTQMIHCISRGTHGTAAHRVSSRPWEGLSIRSLERGPMMMTVSSCKIARPQRLQRRRTVVPTQRCLRPLRRRFLPRSFSPRPSGECAYDFVRAFWTSVVVSSVVLQVLGYLYHSSTPCIVLCGFSCVYARHFRCILCTGERREIVPLEQRASLPVWFARVH